MSGKWILIIEDDRYQAEEIERCLKPIAEHVRLISTELEFHKLAESGELSKYAVAVVDLMLRWTDPAPEMEMPPPKIREEGSYLAGLRCCRELKKLPKNKIPCVIFSALDAEKVPGVKEFPFVNKSHGCEALIEQVRPLLG